MATETPAKRRRTATLHLPLLTAELHAPHVPRPHAPHVSVPHVPMPHASMPTLPGRQQVADLGRGVSDLLPPTDQLALYGGLGAAAALGVLDWPVALAVAAGTAVARHGTLRGTFADVARAVGGSPRTPVPEKAAPATRKAPPLRSTVRKATAKTGAATRTTGDAARRTASGQDASRTAPH